MHYCLYHEELLSACEKRYTKVRYYMLFKNPHLLESQCNKKKNKIAGPLVLLQDACVLYHYIHISLA